MIVCYMDIFKVINISMNIKKNKHYDRYRKNENNFAKKIGKSQEELKESISIHFRLGDYKHIQHCHPILPYMYYKNALKQFSYTQRNVYYFCEEEDKEHVEHIIQQLRKDYTECMFVSVGFELCDWEQLIYMSCCNHNIIANSSFSWWGAYLNEHNDKNSLLSVGLVWTIFGKRFERFISFQLDKN